MLRATRRTAALAAALLMSGACTIEQTDIPGLSGPSGFALSVELTATPDVINHDGTSQSSVVVTAYGPDGRPQAGMGVRLDLMAGGQYTDYGTLSAKNLVTNGDGRAMAIYTAPPAPPPGVPTSAYEVVTVTASPVGSNYENATVATADIRLNMPGVILPPAGTPVAAFTFSPNSPPVGVEVHFDASASQPGGGASSIVSYEWQYGDGNVDTGMQVDHVYHAPGQYLVTLRITNDRGVSATASQVVNVPAGTAPAASFVFSPSNPAPGQTIVFDASTSSPGQGRSIVGYEWVFGDTDNIVHTTSKTYTKTGGYAKEGVYSITLTITDSLGLKTSTTRSVPVGDVEEDDEEEEEP